MEAKQRPKAIIQKIYGQAEHAMPERETSLSARLDTRERHMDYMKSVGIISTEQNNQKIAKR